MDLFICPLFNNCFDHLKFLYQSWSSVKIWCLLNNHTKLSSIIKYLTFIKFYASLDMWPILMVNTELASKPLSLLPTILYSSIYGFYLIKDRVVMWRTNRVTKLFQLSYFTLLLGVMSRVLSWWSFLKLHQITYADSWIFYQTSLAKFSIMAFNISFLFWF